MMGSVAEMEKEWKEAVYLKEQLQDYFVKFPLQVLQVWIPEGHHSSGKHAQ